ncbi:MAG: hypothetical protein QF473_05275 [Planctomycetota bacterium]|jgi:hypothetical protein|nr:hypothetical protein [Planctomycetota bacterium]
MGNPSLAQNKSWKQMMKDPKAYAQKLALAASVVRNRTPAPKINTGLANRYQAIKKTSAFRSATQAAKAGNWQKYKSTMGKVKSQGFASSRKTVTPKPKVAVPWSPFQARTDPMLPNLGRSGQAGTPGGQSVPTSKPSWNKSGTKNVAQSGGQTSQYRKPSSPPALGTGQTASGHRKPLAKPTWNNEAASKAAAAGPVWHEQPGQTGAAAVAKGPVWHDASAAGTSAVASGPVWNESVAQGMSGPTWSDAAQAGVAGSVKAGPVWHDASSSGASALSGAATSSAGPLWSDAAETGDFTSAGGPQWLGDSPAVSSSGPTFSDGASQLKLAGGPVWLDAATPASGAAKLSSKQSATLTELGQNSPALKQAINASPGLKGIVEDSLRQEEEKKEFVESTKRGRRKRAPNEPDVTMEKLQAMKEKAILKSLKAPYTSGKAQTERAVAKTELAESVADILGGYESPKQTDPSKLSIDIEGLEYDPDKHTFDIPKVSERPRRGEALKGEAFHLITEDGKRPAGYLPPGMWGDNPRLKPYKLRTYIPANGPPKDGMQRADGMVFSESMGEWVGEKIYASEVKRQADDAERIKPYKLRTYNPADGPPKDGMQREDGLVFSDSMGEWVNEDIYATEKKRQSDDLARKKDSQKKRDKAWAAYHEKNKDKFFDEYLRETSAELTVAKRRVELSGKVLALRKRAERARTLSEGQLQALENSLQKAIERGATEEELKDITRNYVKIGQAEWEATAANREEGEAYAQLGVDVSHNLGHGAAFAGGFAAAPLGIALDVAMAYSESGGSIKEGRMESRSECLAREYGGRRHGQGEPEFHKLCARRRAGCGQRL